MSSCSVWLERRSDSNGTPRRALTSSSSKLSSLEESSSLSESSEESLVCSSAGASSPNDIPHVKDPKELSQCTLVLDARGAQKAVLSGSPKWDPVSIKDLWCNWMLATPPHRLHVPGK